MLSPTWIGEPVVKLQPTETQFELRLSNLTATTLRLIRWLGANAF